MVPWPFVLEPRGTANELREPPAVMSRRGVLDLSLIAAESTIAVGRSPLMVAA
jgi:hypothetical protein